MCGVVCGVVCVVVECGNTVKVCQQFCLWRLLFGKAKMLRDSQLEATWHAVLQELGGEPGAAAHSGSRSGNAIVVVPIASFNVDVTAVASGGCVATHSRPCEALEDHLAKRAVPQVSWLVVIASNESTVIDQS